MATLPFSHRRVSLPLHRLNGVRVGALLGLLALVLSFSAPFLLADQNKQAASQKQSAKAATLSKSFAGKLPITELSEEEAILHTLNRLAFGPRPGEFERIRQMGLEKWIDQQLHPEQINDSALQARLDRYPTLAMSSAKLMEEYPNPAIVAARQGLTPEEYRRRLQAQQGKAPRSDNGMPPGEMPPPDPNNNPSSSDRPRGRLGNTPGDPQMPLLDQRSPARIVAELSMAKLTRAIYSERQLEEVMTDFWFNHFNVFAGKGPDRWLLTSYERDAIRPNAMGKFGGLLRATAESPAMLFYLDNWMSADPESYDRMANDIRQRRNNIFRLFGGMPLSTPRGRANQQGRLGRQNPNAQQNRQRRGLNENYARELMELHTLGVDGGYSQQDVIEVARAFTGWTLRAPRANPEFLFEDRIHDSKPKMVLGQKIDAGGRRDGEAVLALLAKHPNTARFLSTKLARRFVSDEPPAALVDRMAQSFLKSDGDVRAVLHTMIYSPEFWSRSAYRSKIKKPFELVASAARAVGADVDVALPLVQWSARIGEPLYQCQPPTGYSDKSETWVNTGALLNRLNYALALTNGNIRGVRTDLAALGGGEEDPKIVLDRALASYLAGQVSPETRAVLEKQMDDPKILRATLDDRTRNVDARVIAGLVLGSPEFQRR